MNLDEIILPTDLELMGIDPKDITTIKYPDLKFYVGDVVEFLKDWAQYFKKETVATVEHHEQGPVIFYYAKNQGGMLINRAVTNGSYIFRLISCGEGTPTIEERLGIR